MDIVNKSKFKSVTIMNVKTWSERISGNNIVLGSEKAVFSIYKNVTYITFYEIFTVDNGFKL